MQTPRFQLQSLFTPHKTEKHPVYHTDWELFFDGDSYYHSLITDIRNAAVSILVELYIFETEGIGREILQLLAQKSREGVQIRIIVDGVGSPNFRRHAGKLLEDHGIEFRVFRPVNIFTIFKSGNWRRDHRKLLVIDNNISYIGGMNIADVHSESRTGKDAWRDTMLRLEGEITEEAIRNFEHMWRRLGRRYMLHRKLRNNTALYDGFRLVGNTGRKRRKRALRLYYRTLKRSRHRIYIEMAYFVPRLFLLRILGKQAKRGVDVRLLVSLKSDVPATRWAGRFVFQYLLKKGIRIFIYEKSFLHAKTTIVDDNRAFVGSTNLDNQSLLRNQELDVFIRKAETIRMLRDHYAIDQSYCRELKLAEWRKRPLFHRLLEKFFYFFRYYL